MKKRKVMMRQVLHKKDRGIIVVANGKDGVKFICIKCSTMWELPSAGLKMCDDFIEYREKK